MAVSHSASSESHNGTTGSTNQGSFSWTHPQTGTPQGVLIFVYALNNANNPALTVSYGGQALTEIIEVADTAGEPSNTSLWFLGSGLPSGSQTITVTRGNSAVIMYAVATTVNADTDTFLEGVLTEANNQALTEESIDDGSLSGTDSLRYAAVASGLAAPPGAGANSTLLQTIDAGAFGAAVCRESTAGIGSRPVGFSASADDVSAIYVAVREAAAYALAADLGPFSITGNDATIDYVPVAAAYTLTADAGSVGVIGNVAALQWDVTVAAATGTVSIAGTAAGFTHTALLTSARGIFAVVGYSATLSHNLFLSASAGSYSIVGVASDAIQGFLLTGASRAITISGQPASVVTAKRLTASAGSLSITGKDAVLEWNVKVVASNATYTITGQAATVRYVPTVRFDAGSFTIVGQNASILHTTNLTSSAGIFVVTGTSVPVERGLIVGATKGTYTIATEPASLRKTSDLSTNKGVFHINGTNIQLRTNRYVQGSAGAYSIIGNDAEFSNFLNRTLTADSGSLTTTTIPASWLRTYQITAVKKQITITRIPATLSSTGTPDIEYIISLFAEGGEVEIPIGLRTSYPWWEGDFKEFIQRLLLRIEIGRTYGDE